MRRQPKRIRTVLVKGYVLFILFALVLVAGVSGWLFNIILDETIQNQARQDIEIARGEIVSYISEIETIAFGAAQDSDIVEYVKWMNAGRALSAYPDYAKVQQRLEDMVRSETGMYALGVYGLNIENASYAGRFKMRELYPDMPLDPDYARLGQSSNGMVWGAPFAWQYGARKLFCLHRQITDTQKLTVIGATAIVLESSYLNILLKKVGRLTSCDLYLLYGEQPVAESGGDFSQISSNGALFSRIIREDSALFMDHMSGSPSIVAFEPLRNGWKLLSVNPTQPVEGRLASTRMVIWVICVLACVTSILLSIYISQRLARPIRLLAESARKIDLSGNALKLADDDTFAETAILSRNINKMLERIDELLIRVYEQQIRERDVRIEMLQAQINPHFLYNTLEAINAKLILEEDYATGTMVMALADILRYSISDATQTLRLRDEVEYVYKYLFIQKERLGSGFSYRMSISQEAEEALVLKLLIQPFVENAIQHGLCRKAKGGWVEIGAQREDGQLVIRIRDNGMGMEQSVIDQLLVDESAIRPASATHVGIRNVYNRMLLTYGKENSSMDIQSAPGAGTTVTLRLPYITQ